MKRLKHILNWTIWSLVALYLLLLVLLQIPAIQEWTGRRVASTLSSKLGTEVSVGRVALGLPGSVVIDDVVVLDQQQREMLIVGRLTARIDLLPLLQGRVSVSSAQLFSAHAMLCRADEQSPMNIQFVIDSLTSKSDDKPSSTDIRINSLIIRHSSLSYDQEDSPHTPGQLDLHHLKVKDISGYLSLKVIRPDSLNISVKRLTLNEQSGLQMKRLGLKLEMGNDHAKLKNFSLELSQSTVAIDTLRATFDKQRLLETLCLYSNEIKGTLTPADFAFLQTKLATIPHPVSFACAVDGSLQQLQIPDISLQSDDNYLALKASAEKRGGSWNTEVKRMFLSEDFLSDLHEIVPAIPVYATRIGNLALKGEATSHEDGQREASAEVMTGIGNMDLRLSMSGREDTNLHIETDELNLGRLLNNEQVGSFGASINLTDKPLGATVEGLIDHIEYRGHMYRDLVVNASRQEEGIAGKLKIVDPFVEADVEGNWHDESIRLTGYVHKLAPKALNLSDRWGDATFSAVIDADFSATNFNNAQGSIDLDDFRMCRPAHQTSEDTILFAIDNLHVKSGYADGQHFLRLNSDMGEAKLTGQFDWSTLSQSFIGYVAARLPTLPGLPRSTSVRSGSSTNNNFEATLHLTSTDWLRHLVNIPLTLQKPAHLHIAVSDSVRQLAVNGVLPAFDYAGTHYTNGQIQIDTQADTMSCNVTLTQQMSTDKRNDLTLTAQAANNNLMTSFGWDIGNVSGDPLQRMAGQLNASTILYTNEEGQAEAQVRIRPSLVTLKGITWEVQPSDILFTDRRLLVDHFSVTHADQYLLIDGMASSSPADTLLVGLNGVDISHLLSLVNFRSVRFGGLASGQISLTSIFDHPQAEAHLTVPDFLFQDGNMGMLTADATWDSKAGNIDLSADIVAEAPSATDATAWFSDVTDALPEAHTLVNGQFSTAEKSIDLDIQAFGSPIGFTHSFTHSFLSEISGHTYGQLRLRGPLKEIDLTGSVTVDGQATITALGTTYTFQQSRIDFTPGAITFNDFHVSDRDGQQGVLTGDLRHRHFKQFTFDLHASGDRLLAFNQPELIQGGIGGTVRANCTADIVGRSGEITINCDVSPVRGSTFVYDATSPDAISQQQFITWGDANDLPSTSTVPNSSSLNPSSSAGGSGRGLGDLHINFRINATPDISLRLLMNRQTGDYITLNGNGTITASFYNKGPFQMFGTYNVSQGTYGMTLQNIIKKNFNFQEGGTIVFGGNPFDAALDLQAIYTVNGVSLSDLSIGQSFSSNTVRVNCLMNIQGTAGAPRAEFDLDMPNVNSEEAQMIRSVIASEQELNQQVLYLLAIGRFYTQGANNQNQQYDQTQLAMQSFLSGTVSTQINELLSQVINISDWNFGANISTGNEGWHNAEYEGLISGKMLNNRLLINGQFGYRDNAAQATSSFIGDFDLRYLLTPSGNLALKVYNQTNDRYFTRSSLNTQGVGIILKRDFRGLGDLFHSSSRKQKH